MEDSNSIAGRRLTTIQTHLLPSTDTSNSQIYTNSTAAEFVDDRRYSVVLPEKLNSGKWNVYRSARSPLKLVTRFPHHPEIETLHDNFVHAVDTFPDYKYLGSRVRVDGTVGEYKWMTYGETATARSAIGSGLQFHGLSKGACVGLYFINRPEWLVVDHACSAYSYVSVPLYDTLGPDAVKYIINHADVQAVFCVPSTLNVLLSFLSEISSVCIIVVVGGIDGHLPSLPATSGVQLISYSKLISQGHSNLRPFCPPKANDIATICYTSGTTGTPKGVVLTHENLISSVAASTLQIKFNSSDIYVSYLPLAHIYERANQIMSVYCGIAVGFYQGDNLKLMDDLAVLRPTIFCSVPRLYNRIYAGIVNAVNTSGVLKQRLFNAAYNSKKQALMSGRKPSPIWDRLVFNKIKAKMGGRVRFLGSGASPLSSDIMDFLKVCFGCPVIEGYGMTETACVITIMDETDNLSGHVGSPNPSCEVKLADVPEMNYTSDDQPNPRGEICVRGPSVFQGYYKDEVQTREVIDDEGWLHTGDIGMWLPGGRLKIIDRKKNIFKLAQGEYIAPDKIENVYAKCKFVAQCFVYGDSFNSSLVAIISIDPDVIKDWAASEGIKYDDLRQLCSDPRAKAAVLAEMDDLGREAQLRGFEFAKAVTLVPEPFTVENGLLTPTFKVKRPQAKAFFAKEISNMYAELATMDPTLHKPL
ncbi:putative long-chain-fatty-acid--CoA ligase [Helianthus annuus]|uniref:Long-chain-fatty-acid--CoA ligase n=1 Tax=Helianthus annuus TaxID=4232 RepID=A0A251V910_HELAN|nr:long chain acyl-CoA synthetase 7, peroxisomal [Helianthus annuus]KAF5813638.1 putative long-chain-fatty-acid--CoA ligase [Helianthus annuus]KAJ0592366.1 putative long-chain-fatty-acid--CoA ligase [Helianthus annuus]KAJ0599899.1 putative long-chain-fatty-acid--CoA ligase [Helianthus annuus]KAJ0607352.1 putative long-chain-fatty-acid--CoA ligase [Helianthus annuus]KAJ0767407.1 putative long-chain-fatty-acid--CoA ligase [Helianthus annuus]